MRCYENDILPHKAPVFSWPRMAAWLHVRRTCHSIALNLTLLPALSRSTVLPWSFSYFAVCTHPFSVPPYLCLKGYLHTFLPTHTFLSLNFGKYAAHAKWFTLTANVLPLLIVKGFCYFVSPQSHRVSNFVTNSTAPYSWPMVYSREWENYGKDNDMQQNVFINH